MTALSWRKCLCEASLDYSRCSEYPAKHKENCNDIKKVVTSPFVPDIFGLGNC